MDQKQIILKILQETHGDGMATENLTVIADRISNALQDEQPEYSAQLYCADALRTKSENFHLELVSETELGSTLRLFALVCAQLDSIKRRLFYGRDKKQWTSIPLFFSFQYKPPVPSAIHAVLGLATEAGEMAETLLQLYGGKVSLSEACSSLAEESGDSFWYHALLAESIDSTFTQTWKANISKLRQRYPEKFTEEKAVNRDLAAEQKALKEI